MWRQLLARDTSGLELPRRWAVLGHGHEAVGSLQPASHLAFVVTPARVVALWMLVTVAELGRSGSRFTREGMRERWRKWDQVVL
jgi:hypothetical protein